MQIKTVFIVSFVLKINNSGMCKKRKHMIEKTRRGSFCNFVVSFFGINVFKIYFYTFWKVTGHFFLTLISKLSKTWFIYFHTDVKKKQSDPEAVTSFLSFWLLSYGIINYKKKQIQDLVSLQES